VSARQSEREQVLIPTSALPAFTVIHVAISLAAIASGSVTSTAATKKSLAKKGVAPNVLCLP
jgi:hypothetical protein